MLHPKACRTLPLLLLSWLLFATETAHAQTQEESRAMVLREANADGALIALALHCKQSKDEVNRLAEKLEALTMALARSKSVALDSATYIDVANDGYLHTREVLSLTGQSEDAFRDRCAEVQSKVRIKLAQ